MKKKITDSEKVEPALKGRPKTIHVKVTHEKGQVVIDNGIGNVWKVKGVSTGVALTSLIAYTLETRDHALSMFSDNFEIHLTIEEIIY